MAIPFRNLQGGNPYQGLANTMESVSSRVGASFMSYAEHKRRRDEQVAAYQREKEKSMVDAIVKLVPAAAEYEMKKDAITYGKEQDKLDRQYKQSVLDEAIASREQTGEYQTAMLGEQRASREQRGEYQESVLEEQKASREQAGQYQAGMLEKQTKMLQNSNKIKEITALTRLENAQINKLKQQNLTDKIPFDQYETAAKLAEDVSTARLTRKTRLYELYTDIYGEADDLTNPNRDPETGVPNETFDVWVTTASNLGGYGMSEEEFNKLSEPFTYLDVYRQAGVKLTDENSAPKEEAESTVLDELTSENNARLSGGSGGGLPFDWSGKRERERYSGLGTGTGIDEKETSSTDITEVTKDTNLNKGILEKVLDPKKFHVQETEEVKLSPQEENELILERLATLSDEKLRKVATEVGDQRLAGLIRSELARREKDGSSVTTDQESGGGFGTAQAGIQKQKDELPVYKTVDIQKGSTLGDMYKLAKKNGFDPSVYYNEAQKKKGAPPHENIKIFKNAWSDHRESQGLIRLGEGDGEIPPRGEDLVLPKFWSDPVVDEAPVMRSLPKRSALEDGTETDQGEPVMSVSEEAIKTAADLAETDNKSSEEQESPSVLERGMKLKGEEVKVEEFEKRRDLAEPDELEEFEGQNYLWYGEDGIYETSRSRGFAMPGMAPGLMVWRDPKGELKPLIIRQKQKESIKDFQMRALRTFEFATRSRAS